MKCVHCYYATQEDDAFSTCTQHCTECTEYVDNPEEYGYCGSCGHELDDCYCAEGYSTEDSWD